MGKCTVLFLASNPADTHPLRLDDEIREIRKRIQAAAFRDAMELTSRWAVRAKDLQEALLETQPRIVQFSGRGQPGGAIILKDRDGQPQPVSQEALAGLFSLLRDRIRLVVLNACYSRPQAEAIVETIDCAVGMKDVVSDETAIAFSASLYQAIGYGRSVQKAFDLGKNQVELEGIPVEDLPELMLREGIDASKIHLVPKPPEG